MSSKTLEEICYDGFATTVLKCITLYLGMSDKINHLLFVKTATLVMNENKQVFAICLHSVASGRTTFFHQ